MLKLNDSLRSNVKLVLPEIKTLMSRHAMQLHLHVEHAVDDREMHKAVRWFITRLDELVEEMHAQILDKENDQKEV